MLAELDVYRGCIGDRLPCTDDSESQQFDIQSLRWRLRSLCAGPGRARLAFSRQMQLESNASADLLLSFFLSFFPFFARALSLSLD